MTLSCNRPEKEEKMAVEPLRQQAVSATPLPAEAPQEHEMEIDLLELFYRILENIKFIVLITVICTLLMGIYTFYFVTPQYEATAKIYVLNSSDSVVNLSDLQIGSYLTSDYQEVFKTWEVNERVISNLNLPYTYRQLQNMVSVTNPSNTRILYITAKSPNPTEAAQIANEFASVSREYISQTMATETPNILSDALKPTIPVSPNKTRNLVLGFLVGALLGIGIVVVRFMLDDKVKSSEDIMKYAGIPTLTVVPVLGGAQGQKRANRRGGD